MSPQINIDFGEGRRNLARSGTFDTGGNPYVLELKNTIGNVDVVVDPDSTTIDWELFGTEEAANKIEVSFFDGVLKIISHEKKGNMGGRLWRSLKRTVGVNMVVRLPDNVTASTVEVSVGNLTVRGGSLGLAEITSSTGDVSVSYCAGSEDVDCPSRIKSGIGDVFVGIGSRIQVDCGVGEASVESLHGDARVKVGTGEIKIKRFTGGSLTASAGVGDVEIRVPRGTAAYLDCSSGIGDVDSTLEITGEPDVDAPRVAIAAKTGVGDVTIAYA